MGEIVNLRLARKAKVRSKAEKRAEENRVKFGQTKAEKNLRRAEKNRADGQHEAGRIEPTPSASRDAPDDAETK